MKTVLISCDCKYYIRDFSSLYGLLTCLCLYYRPPASLRKVRGETERGTTLETEVRQNHNSVQTCFVLHASDSIIEHVRSLFILFFYRRGNLL